MDSVGTDRDGEAVAFGCFFSPSSLFSFWVTARLMGHRKQNMSDHREKSVLNFPIQEAEVELGQCCSK